MMSGWHRSGLLVGSLSLTLFCLAAGEREEENGLESMRRLVADGSYAQAEALARQYIQQEERAGQGESKEVAEAMLVLVETLWRGGKERDPESRMVAERCIELCRKVFGEEHPNFATSLNGLAILKRR